MDSPKVRVEEVVVQHPLRTVSEGQPRPPLAVAELGRAADFLAAEHGNQAGGQFPLPDRLVD